MKNTRKRKNLRKQSRKYKNKNKKGGKKNQGNYLSTITSMTGGEPPARAPAPAITGVNYNLNYASVKDSLTTFGNVAWRLKQAVDTGEQAAAQRIIAANADREASVALKTATQALYDAFNGVAGQTTGLYKTLLPSDTWTAPPALPSSSPAPS
jgi:hypothetical protein